MLVDEYHHDKISDLVNSIWVLQSIYVTTYFDEIYCGFYFDTYHILLIMAC